ncbi:MAG: magnesium/cobalt transporter CorA [archaeon]
MIKSAIVFDSGKMRNVAPEQLSIPAQKGFVWVDIEDPEQEDYDRLKDVLPLHPLAWGSIQDSYARPKLIEFESHLLMVFHEPVLESKSISFSRLGIFLGKNFLVTVHRKSLRCIDSVMQNMDANFSLLKKTPSAVAYLILDLLVDNYFPVIDSLEAKFAEAEDNVLVHHDEKALEKIFLLKRQVLELRKKVVPQRESLSMLSRHDSKMVDPSIGIYFRDIYDHMIRVDEMLDSYRDLMTNLLDAYISVQSNKLNEIIKLLTVISTIILPLTLIVGFYGMNIVFPEVQSLGVNFYYVILVVMAIVTVAMIIYFRRKKWL